MLFLLLNCTQVALFVFAAAFACVYTKDTENMLARKYV